ncbi:MAG: proteasome assembly chaperone family protein [Crenarchaeota archaeon]|nr:proteasome assembly chaperone family protein [Thermoproteota archaeon]
MKRVRYVPIEGAPQDFEGSIMVTGFMGFGLVGFIATDFLVNKLEPQKVGYFVTKYLPEQISYSEKNGIELPFELYFKEVDGKKLLILMNRWTPVSVERFAYADFVIKWAKKRGVEALYTFGGLDNNYREDPKERLRWVKTSYYKGPLPEAKPMTGGLKVVGPLALILAAAETRGFPALALLPFCESMRQDPRASAVGLEEFAKLVGLKLDVRELVERAESIEKELDKLRKMMEVGSGRESHYM